MEFKMSDYGKSLFSFGTALAYAEKDRLEQGKRLVAAGKVQGGKRTQDVDNEFSERSEK